MMRQTYSWPVKSMNFSLKNKNETARARESKRAHTIERFTHRGVKEMCEVWSKRTFIYYVAMHHRWQRLLYTRLVSTRMHGTLLKIDRLKLRGSGGDDDGEEAKTLRTVLSRSCVQVAMTSSHISISWICCVSLCVCVNVISPRGNINCMCTMYTQMTIFNFGWNSHYAGRFLPFSSLQRWWSSFNFCCCCFSFGSPAFFVCAFSRK